MMVVRKHHVFFMSLPARCVRKQCRLRREIGIAVLVAASAGVSVQIMDDRARINICIFYGCDWPVDRYHTSRYAYSSCSISTAQNLRQHSIKTKIVIATKFMLSLVVYTGVSHVRV